MAMNKFEIGDRVAVLDDAISGVVVQVKNDQISIQTDDDFMMTFFVNELVKENNTNDLDYFSKSDASHKIKIDTTPTRAQKNFTFKSDKRDKGAPEFDLHIEKLVKNFRGMSNFDILTIQLETAQRHVEFALKNRIPKIVLIHGVGEGILKTELEFLLRKYPQVTFQEANYQKYGMGATEIYFQQNSK